MLARTETIATIADHWLAQFERALAEPDDVLLKTLFHPESHWRDVLALTWHIRTVNGLDAILREGALKNQVQHLWEKMLHEKTLRSVGY